MKVHLSITYNAHTFAPDSIRRYEQDMAREKMVKAAGTLVVKMLGIKQLPTDSPDMVTNELKGFVVSEERVREISQALALLGLPDRTSKQIINLIIGG